MPVDFDIQSARDAGASDKEIAEFLATQQDFDIAGARATGVDDAQISNFLVTGEQPTSVGIPQALGEGGLRGLGEIVGLPGTIAETVSETRFGRFIPGFGADPLSRAVRGVITPSGEQIAESLNLTPPAALPKGERIAVKTGEVIGASLPFVLAPLGLARTGIGILPEEAIGPARVGLGGQILAAARTSPTSFAIAEAGGLTGAAGGAALAEAADPGDVGTALIAEIAGGFLNPLGLIGRITGGSKNSFLRLVGSFQKSGREARAAAILQDIFEETGENVDEVVRLLNAATIRGGTAAQKSASPTLVALERQLARRSAKFGAKAAESERNALASLRQAADNLAAAGDPASLRVAAKLRKQYHEELLDQQIEVARRAVVDAQAKLGKGTPADLAERSRATGKILDDALGQARKAETELWDKIPRDISTGTQNLRSALDDSLNRLLPEEIPELGAVGKAARRIAGSERTTSGELLKLRRRALAGSREAKAKQDFTRKAVLDDIAEGALQELSALQGDAVDIARGFSRALNDKFTRSFGGSTLATTRTGARRIPPELLLEEALGGGGTRGSLRFRELREAAGFADDALLSGVRNEQEQFLRIAARETSTDGVVDPAKLETFVKRNRAVLDEFPALRQELSNAASAQRAFGEAQSAVATSRTAAKEAAFSIVLENESPRRAVAQVLSGKNPGRGYRELAKLAKSGDAADGLMSATLDHAIQKATSETGEFSLTRFNRILNEPLSRGQSSLMQLMRRDGILRGPQFSRLNKILKEAETLERALKSGKEIDKFLDNPQGLFDLVVRITGARIGAAGASGTTGATIVAAGAGSRFARNLFEKVPATRINDVLIEASENPAFMAALLKKPKTLREANKTGRQINAFLIGAGIVAQ